MILFFLSSNFLTDGSRAVHLYLCSTLILPCMCLAALWPPVGEGAKAVVAGALSPAFAGPSFWPSMLSAVSLFLVSADFL